MELYRFRPNSDYVIDELQNNYLFFALPDELNDPMEGFLNMYWEGDIVLWKNFLKHFLYTLCYTIFRIYIDPEEIKEPLFTRFDESNFPTKRFQEIFEDIRDFYFKDRDIKEFFDYLVNIKHYVFFQELKHYLFFINIPTLSIVLNRFKEHHLLDWNMPQIKGFNVFEKFKSLMPLMEKQYPEFISKIFEISQEVKKTIELSFKLTCSSDEKGKLKSFFLFDFPEKYIDEVKFLAFSTPCITCFTENFNSPSAWSHYASEHKGICLIFDDQKPSDEIHFDFRTTWGGVFCSTQKVKYQIEYPAINFFRMLGSLSLFALDRFWLTDWEGNRSTYLKNREDYLSDEWRKEYNKNLTEVFSIKGPDWQNEKEHRIVLQKEIEAGDSEDDRKFNYRFDLLKGIIFGLKTEDSFKVEVIQIITKKCKELGRRDFKFYQAEYNEETGKIDKIEIKL